MGESRGRSDDVDGEQAVVDLAQHSELLAIVGGGGDLHAGVDLRDRRALCDAG